MAGLPAISAWVLVGPPLSANTSSFASAVVRSPVPPVGQPVPMPTRLWPRELIPAPKQSSRAALPELPKTMVLFKVTVPKILKTPPPEPAELPVKVELLTVVEKPVPILSRPPPLLLAELPLNVVLEMVAVEFPVL